MERGPGGSFRYNFRTVLEHHQIRTPHILNQQNSPTCFAHAGVTVIDYARILRGLPDRFLSPQHIIDCSYFCIGAETEESNMYETLRYNTNVGTCEMGVHRRFDGLRKTNLNHRCLRNEYLLIKIDGYSLITCNNEAIVRSLLTEGPLAITIDMDLGPNPFRDSTGDGIIVMPRPRDEDNIERYSVVIVGCGRGWLAQEECMANYLTVQSSYGRAWGRNGEVDVFIPNDETSFNPFFDSVRPILNGQIIPELKASMDKALEEMLPQMFPPKEAFSSSGPKRERSGGRKKRKEWMMTDTHLIGSPVKRICCSTLDSSDEPLLVADLHHPPPPQIQKAGQINQNIDGVVSKVDIISDTDSDPKEAEEADVLSICRIRRSKKMIEGRYPTDEEWDKNRKVKEARKCFDVDSRSTNMEIQGVITPVDPETIKGEMEATIIAGAKNCGLQEKLEDLQIEKANMQCFGHTKHHYITFTAKKGSLDRRYRVKVTTGATYFRREEKPLPPECEFVWLEDDQVFHKKHKRGMLEAMEKLKNELMVLGFISLVLTVGQPYFSKICLPVRYSNMMLPCPPRKGSHNVTDEPVGGEEEHHRRLLWNARRILSSLSDVGCEQGRIPLISVHGMHQLHIFIFFLAVFHVIYSAITMTLGRMKIREWKVWEVDCSINEESMNDPARFRLNHETSFVKDHLNYAYKSPILFYTVCFFQQFFRSVRMVDYLTLRHAFLTVHLTPGSNFNFQKYLKRSLEQDFKVVVGISPLLWASVVTFLLLNVYGWQTMLWDSVLPLLLILAVGTKLQAIISRMAIEIKEKHAVVQGIPLAHLSDRNFWFGWPQLVLYLIHFVLFQNAFEITYFFWVWYEFGLYSCFNSNMTLVSLRVTIGVAVQWLCSYVTLPLYALVSQMGSTMRHSVFEEETTKALKKWRKRAKRKTEDKEDDHSTVFLGGQEASSQIHSPTAPRSRTKSRNHSFEDIDL